MSLIQSEYLIKTIKHTLHYVFASFQGYDMTMTLQTGMPAGTYCDIITGNPGESPCAGATITVGSDGNAEIFISGSSEDPIVAIHV